MIKIVILAPYQDVKSEIEQAVADYSPPEPIDVSVYAMSADQLEGISFQADVLIARGFSAAKLKKILPDQLVVPMQISAYDVMDAITTAIARYQPHHIGLIGLPDTAQMAERASRLLESEVHSYPVSDISNLESIIRQAREQGCDCFVGGLSTVRCLDSQENSVLLQIGKSAVISSLEEAVRLVQSTREQRERSLQYHTILDHIKEGVISLDENRTVNSINQFALRYLGLDSPVNCIGRPVNQLMPFASEALESVFKDGLQMESEVYRFGERMLSLDCIPLLRGRQTISYILIIRSVNRLQNQEADIRRKMQAKEQKAKYRFENIVHRSAVMDHAIQKARLYARAESSVLIVGESGTGKELFAQSIHNASRRESGPFVAINCAALPESLLESELFGYSDGAFTGALKGGKQGLFEAAHGGTLFLDEISEIPVSFQSKLLRVLQENEVRRIGSQRVFSIDVRVIAATNRDLVRQVEQGLFRQDLLFRLNVLHLYIPPLRSRGDDVMELFQLYTREFAALYGKNLGMVTQEAGALLKEYNWNGNVRELKNIAERICVLCPGDIIDVTIVREALYGETLLASGGSPRETAETVPVTDEKSYIRTLLQRYQGNRGLVAEALGVDRSTLWRKMKRYGLF